MFRIPTLHLIPSIPLPWGRRRVAPTRDVRRTGLKSLSAVGGCLIGLALILPWHLGRVKGQSMTPTLQPGSLFLYERTNLRPDQLRQGDVVVFRHAGELWIKRVYARAGDRILVWHELKGEMAGHFPVAEAEAKRYVRLAAWINQRGPAQARLIRQQIPPDHVFVIGDGPTSVDSRVLGPIHASQIVGRVIPLPGQDLGRMPRALELPGRGMG